MTQTFVLVHCLIRFKKLIWKFFSLGSLEVVIKTVNHLLKLMTNQFLHEFTVNKYLPIVEGYQQIQLPPLAERRLIRADAWMQNPFF